MGRRKRTTSPISKATNKITKLDSEQSICRNKLEALEREELLSAQDRFSAAEKRTLLDAYNDHGFHVFQNTQLLKSYFPHRKETELKDLIIRLQTKLAKPSEGEQYKTQNLADWTQLANKSINTLSRAKKINMDNLLADTMLHMTQSDQPQETVDPAGNVKPDYNQIKCNIYQLLLGRFPDRLSRIDAQISQRLYEDLNKHVDTLELAYSLKAGTWLRDANKTWMSFQSLALEGLAKVDSMANKCPTNQDLEKDPSIEALCLELPKIKRITDTLNPLNISEGLYY